MAGGKRHGVQVFDQLALWVFHHPAVIFPPQAKDAFIAGVPSLNRLQQIEPDFLSFAVDQVINIRVLDGQLRQRSCMRPANDGRHAQRIFDNLNQLLDVVVGGCHRSERNYVGLVINDFLRVLGQGCVWT